MAKRKKKIAPWIGSPIELHFRNAICHQASGVPSHDLTMLDYSTSKEPAVATKNKFLFFDVASEGMDDDIDERLFAWGNGKTIWCLFRSVMVDRYRVDFLLVAANSSVAVECDGHDFHERTKQQASSDRARDRALLRLGLPTLRFTGSDLFHRADECAVEVIETLKALEVTSYNRSLSDGFDMGWGAANQRAERARLRSDWRGVFAGSLAEIG